MNALNDNENLPSMTVWSNVLNPIRCSFCEKFHYCKLIYSWAGDDLHMFIEHNKKHFRDHLVIQFELFQSNPINM